MSRDLRREFLTLIGTTYDQYGYPEYCGWIEGLLLLEPKKWTQREISTRLNALFPESKYPTSVPSVNRALKILENYGVVEKTGSRKTGYHYAIASSSNLVISMLLQFITINRSFIVRLEDLSASIPKQDSGLSTAVDAELKAARIWDRTLSRVVDLIGNEI
jgi:DNA-binding transcriptional regulator GbsR (MarR family)